MVVCSPTTVEETRDGPARVNNSVAHTARDLDVRRGLASCRGRRVGIPLSNAAPRAMAPADRPRGIDFPANATRRFPGCEEAAPARGTMGRLNFFHRPCSRVGLIVNDEERNDICVCFMRYATREMILNSSLFFC